MKYQGSWHEAKASKFSASTLPPGEPSASRTTSLVTVTISSRDKVARQNRATNCRCDVGLKPHYLHQ